MKYSELLLEGRFGVVQLNYFIPHNHELMHICRISLWNKLLYSLYRKLLWLRSVTVKPHLQKST